MRYWGVKIFETSVSSFECRTAKWTTKIDENQKLSLTPSSIKFVSTKTKTLLSKLDQHDKALSTTTKVSHQFRAIHLL